MLPTQMPVRPDSSSARPWQPGLAMRALLLQQGSGDAGLTQWLWVRHPDLALPGTDPSGTLLRPLALPFLSLL